MTVLAVIALLGVAVLRPASRNADTKSYNVVIFAFDGLQAHHLSAYGYTERDVTPHLDAFLKSATVFTNTVSPASWTVPTFMSIFTSRYPSEHKLTNKLVAQKTATSTVVRQANMQALSPGIETLAQILKRHGYATGGFTGDAGVSGSFGYKEGFDTYFDTKTFGGFETSIPPALAWLRDHTQEKFFMFVHGYDVHGQHEPEDGFDYRYVRKPYAGTFTGSPKEQAALREQGLAGKPLDVSASDVDFWRSIYDEKINDADAAFGAFIHSLNTLGLATSTIVVVVSDHGTEFFEHGRVDHGHTLYRELLDVLFAIHVPGSKGHMAKGLVSTLDLAPTLLSLLKIDDPAREHMKGTDLTRALDGKKVEHDVYSETDYRLYTHKRSITTTDGWKFILTRETGAEELYDLKNDPGETRNLASEQPKKAYELAQKLYAHLRDIGDIGPWPIGCLPVYADQCR